MDVSKIYTAKSVAAFWNSYNENSNTQPYFGEAIFPPKKKLGLDLKWIKGNSGVPVALKPTAFDALPNIRNRIGVQAIQTEMPFFREGMLFKESDRQEINRALDSNDPYAKVVIENVYNDSVNLINGANVTAERMRMQLLSPEEGSPKIYIDSDGITYEYDYDVDGKFKDNNFKALTGTSMWTDYKKSDPIQDISDAQDAIENSTGSKPTIMLLSKKTMKDIVNNEKIASYILAKAQASGGAVRVTTGLVQQYLLEELGITCVVNSKKFEEDGVKKAFYPDDMVTLLPAEGLGNTYYGTTPEESDLMTNNEANVAIVNTGVAVTVITENKVPVQTKTYASEIVMPSFEGMEKVFVIKTNTTPVGTGE